MIEKFERYIRDNSLFHKKDKILLAFSSGMDSVVLAHLLMEAGYPFALAHCNFNLRGQESDDDESFAHDFARKYGLEIFTKSFDTNTFAEEKGVSTQMAARELRYEWFEQVRTENSFTLIVTAHHKDDQCETLLINMVRGTGLSGLSGIRPRSGYLVRPLLCFDRTEIESYSAEQQITFRDDSSNQETKYIRNKIRHEVIPVLKSINPSLADGMMDLSERVAESEKLLEYLMRKTFLPLIKPDGEKVFIPIDPIMESDSVTLVLFQLLKEYGFHGPVIHDIASLLTAQPGKIFSSNTHICLKDRTQLIIYPKTEGMETDSYQVTPETKEIVTGSGTFLFEKLYDFPQERIIPDPNKAYVNAELLEYPLILRHPVPGDAFTPLGMTGRKKISDFLTDQKIPLMDKAKVWLLCSGNRIVWVAGMRTDKHFRLNRVNKEVLLVKYISG